MSSDLGTTSIVCAGWAHYQLMPQNDIPLGTSQIRCPSSVFIARITSEINFKYAQNSLSLSLLVIQKKLSCFGISGFELSLESCSPLTVLHIACYVENKCTLFLMFIPFFLSLPHFSNVHIINTACPTDAVSLKCTGGLFYSPALRIQHCALVGLWQNSARVQTPHLGRA